MTGERESWPLTPIHTFELAHFLNIDLEREFKRNLKSLIDDKKEI